LTQIQRDTDNVFQDTYVLDFLNLKENFEKKRKRASWQFDKPQSGLYDKIQIVV
jgi:predicted nuclease of restriction endonuclease-like (RecB) superfamily